MRMMESQLTSLMRVKDLISSRELGLILLLTFISCIYHILFKTDSMTRLLNLNFNEEGKKENIFN